MILFGILAIMVTGITGAMAVVVGLIMVVVEDVVGAAVIEVPEAHAAEALAPAVVVDDAVNKPALQLSKQRYTNIIN
jgi:hypothetical protein